MSQSLKACLLYTPDREHFGIVPVEAMYAARHMCGDLHACFSTLEPSQTLSRRHLVSPKSFQLHLTKARVPVVAVNTGGPLESIVDGVACLPKISMLFQLWRTRAYFVYY